jgi:hypothetical protein
MQPAALGCVPTIAVANDSFNDWFGPHDRRVYRFNLS